MVKCAKKLPSLGASGFDVMSSTEIRMHGYSIYSIAILNILIIVIQIS